MLTEKTKQVADKALIKCDGEHDVCANCSKAYSHHLVGTYCRIGSNQKWFPQRLADAIVESTQKIEESA